MKKLLLSLLLLVNLSALNAASIDLMSTLNSVETRIKNSTGDYSHLMASLTSIKSELFNVNPLDLDLELEKTKALETVTKLHTIKLMLQSSLNGLPIDYAGRDDIAEDVKTVISSIRYLEDYLYEQIYNTLPTKPKDKMLLPFTNLTAFSTKGHDFDGSIESLKTGDIIIVRTLLFLGAMISRIGDAPLTYSHMALVYADPVTNKKYVVESTLNTGFKKTELTPAFFENMVRVAVYRPKNSELGRMAGNFGNEKFEEGIRIGKPLQYDLSMGLKENCKYYCSKFVSWAYNSIQQKEVIPEFPSRLLHKNGGYLEGLSIPKASKYTFAPTDIDLDSTFHLIYEYRNPKLTPAARLNDLIVDKMFFWLRTENLEFVPGPLHDQFARFVVGLAGRPYINRIMSMLGMHLNTEIKPKNLALLAASMLYVTKMRKAIAPAYKEHYEKYGVPMSPKEIYKLIDKVRKENPSYVKQFRKRTPINMCLRFYTLSKAQ
tara:strand:+ start:25391 stop:26857 length:1467 start_codon:yes stop_codon:yes gene_type:complete